jgi:hypothetical protein
VEAVVFFVIASFGVVVDIVVPVEDVLNSLPRSTISSCVDSSLSSSCHCRFKVVPAVELGMTVGAEVVSV